MGWDQVGSMEEAHGASGAAGHMVCVLASWCQEQHLSRWFGSGVFGMEGAGVGGAGGYTSWLHFYHLLPSVGRKALSPPCQGHSVPAVWGIQTSVRV
jgi:hypothetical protein